MPREPPPRQTPSSRRTPYQRNPHSTPSETASLYEQPALHLPPFISQPCGYPTSQRPPMYHQQISLPSQIPNYPPFSVHAASQQYFDPGQYVGSRPCQTVQAEADLQSYISPVPSIPVSSQFIPPGFRNVDGAQQSVFTGPAQFLLNPPSTPSHHRGAPQHIPPPPPLTPFGDYHTVQHLLPSSHAIPRYAMQPTAALPHRHFSPPTRARPSYHSLDSLPYPAHTLNVGHSRRDQGREPSNTFSPEISTSQYLPVSFLIHSR
jgi:hypothetical protein